jgi:hypothetical protein
MTAFDTGPGRSCSPTPDGIDFAYQVASEKLAVQLDTIDKVDSKLGVVIGALVALAVLYSSTARHALAALVLLAPVIAAGLGYGSRQWTNAPNPHVLTTFANLGKQRMQEEALAVILLALKNNRSAAQRKAMFLNVSLGLSFLAVVALIVMTAIIPNSM